LLLAAATASAADRPGDWTGNYSPCERHVELTRRGPMHLGVRFSTANPALAAEFARAMSFWATVLDITWKPEDSRQCAIQVVDGDPGLFKPGEAARAQFPGAHSFQGWIAFNPKVALPPSELFATAVHELGHLMGLPHSTNPSSVMYFLSVDGPAFLDQADVLALALHHRLRTPLAVAIRNPVSIDTAPASQVTNVTSSAQRATQ
jgi:hypothetical protein